MKKNNFKEAKNIVTAIIFWLLLVAGLLGALYLTSQKTNLFSKAGVLSTPQNVTISNVSDNSFTVSWITKTPSYGFVSFGDTSDLGSIVYDERDLAERKQRLTHFVVVKNLLPDTVYYFKIGSGPNTFGQGDGSEFTQKTALTPEMTPPIPEFVFGQIKKADESMPDEAIIYLAVGKGTLLSAYTRREGNWLITLNNSRTTDASGDYLTISPDDQIDVFVEGGGDGVASKQATVKTGSQLEKITLDSGKISENPGVGGTVSKRLDISVLKENFGKTGMTASDGDLNGDGIVNANDFAIFFKNQF